MTLLQSIESAIKAIESSPWVMFGVIGVGLICLMFFTKPKPTPIGRSRFATPGEFRRCQRKSLKEINGTLAFPFFKRVRRGVTLLVGLPKRCSVSPSGLIALKPSPATVLLPNASEHIGVLGTTGAGKTRFVLNRLAFGAVLLGLPIIAIDLKGDEEKYTENSIAPTSEVAGFALEHGYRVFAIAPFFPDSDCLNPLDLLRDRTDSATANATADSYVSNDDGEENTIWTSTGSKTLAAAMLAVKGLKQPFRNMAMVQQVLARIAENPKALQDLSLSQYQKAAFATFSAAIASPETASSVMFTAMNAINKLILPEVTAVFCRDTTIPIVLRRKQMLIFRVHPLYKSVVMPLISACIEQVLARNVYQGAGCGGLALLDELPQYYLPTLTDTQAVARSKGWCIAWGAQGMGILEKKYGEAGVQALLENTQTEIVMRISSKQTADDYSSILGDEDIKARSETSGYNSSSTNTSDTQRALVTTQQLRGQATGHALLISPGIGIQEGRKKWVKIPVWHQFIVSRSEQRAMDRAKQTWLSYRQRAIARSKAEPYTEDELKRLADAAAQLLPSVKKQTANKIRKKL